MSNTHTANSQFNDIVCNSIRNLDGLVFFGDPHGQFEKLLRAGLADTTTYLFILGDFFDREFDDNAIDSLRDVFNEFERKQRDFYFITGNHDAASLALHKFLYEEFADHNLNGRIVTVGNSGVRVAGLGGVFRGRIWFPQSASLANTINFRSPADLLKSTPRHEHVENGLPLKHRETIFPSQVKHLSLQGSADVLIAHEAPSTNFNGFFALDKLANDLGVSLIVHGHHHTSNEAILNHKIAVKSLALAEAWTSKCPEKEEKRLLEDEIEQYFNGPSEGMVVLSKIGDNKSAEGKKLSQRFQKFTQQKLPLKTIDFELQSLYDELSIEFPWAVNVVEHIVGNLAITKTFSVGEPVLRFNPTLLVGPKGTGKTSLLKRLCVLSHIPMQLVSGAMPDSGGFLPVARGWATAQPSGLFSFMVENECANPAVFIDELDKAKAIDDNRNGNLQASLLSMVGADRYFDNCLQGDLNLSKISWFASANSSETVYEPLLDRFTSISMEGPTRAHIPAVMQNIKNELSRSLGCDVSLLPDFPNLRPDLMVRDNSCETFSLRELKRNYEERLKQHCVHENKLQFSAKLFSDLNLENLH